MPKILIKKPKTTILENKKEKTFSRYRKYYLKNADQDFSCTEGQIKKEDINLPPGSIIKSNKGVEFTTLNPTFADDYQKIERSPQIIPKKDVGLILAETGVTKDSTVVDAGAGSGALTLFLAKHVKQVTAYDINKKHLEVVKNNIEFLKATNVTLKEGDITKGIEEKELDLITLDLPNPWDAINTAKASLKPGAFLVSYSPTIPQVMDFVNTIRKDEAFLVLKTIELIQREWDVKERKVRPKTDGIGHSGFLTFVRKIQ